MTMRVQFSGFKRLFAELDEAALQKWMHAYADAAIRTFRNGMRGAKGGRVYGGHKASAPGEYPAVWSGRLFSSIKKRVSSRSFRIGSTAPHAGYLYHGTRFMAKRKMADAALRETPHPPIGRFVRFRNG